MGRNAGKAGRTGAGGGRRLDQRSSSAFTCLSVPRSPRTLHEDDHNSIAQWARKSSTSSLPEVIEGFLHVPEQPVFYPVLNREYAERIACDWNTKGERSGFTGYVLGFEVDAACLNGFEAQKAGGKDHWEFWVPAEELEEFNRHVMSVIRVVAGFAGTERQQ